MKDTIVFPAPGRADVLQLSDQRQAIIEDPAILAVINSVPDMILVLNSHLQIVAVNRPLLATFGVADQALLIGMRPGEAIRCIHSSEGPDGCGTSETCLTCGASVTIRASRKNGARAEGACRIVISSEGGTTLDLKVTATPLDVAGTPFTVFALRDNKK